MTTTLNLRGTIVDFSRPKIMGILNVTDDSFYDGGRHNTLDRALLQVDKMLQEGADLIDIGGQSTRPGATTLSAEEELDRILPVFEAIKSQFPNAFVSIDTYYSTIADTLLSLGADVINDVSSGEMDPEIIDVVASYQCPYILMHHCGIPAGKSHLPADANVLTEVFDYFVRKMRILQAKNVHQVILDPGFGFGKTIDQNYQLLRNLSFFQTFDHLILAGISRKSMIYKLLDISPEEALSATSALHMCALQNGARLLRVHDVKEAAQVVRLFDKLTQLA